eukprot:jgi/Psemu1/317031/fgenesh1_kg.5211_\
MRRMGMWAVRCGAVRYGVNHKGHIGMQCNAHRHSHSSHRRGARTVARRQTSAAPTRSIRSESIRYHYHQQQSVCTVPVPSAHSVCCVVAESRDSERSNPATRLYEYRTVPYRTVHTECRTERAIIVRYRILRTS